MNVELQKKLKNDYPEIFKYLYLEEDDIPNDFDDRMGLPIELFGIECDNGWFTLIDTLCNTIKNICQKSDTPKVHQIKEKYGGMRFYIGSMSKDTYKQIHGAIMLAENMSYKICEKCGTTNNVKLDESGWIRTLCEDCRNE